MTQTNQINNVKSDETVDQDWTPGQEAELYVVVRYGPLTLDEPRVSDNEYISPDWPGAVQERNFWQRVVNRYPDGTKVAIVKFIKKKHRTY